MGKSNRNHFCYHRKTIVFGFLVFVLCLTVGYSLLKSDLDIIGSIVVYKKSEPVIKIFTSSDTSAFHSSTYRSKIVSITLENNISIPNDAIASWDISADQRGKVMSYIVINSDDDTKYDLYIQGDGHIYANPNSSYLFSNMGAVSEINNIQLLDTSRVTNMSYMFNAMSSLTSLDLSSFNTNNVTDMSYMFAGKYSVQVSTGMDTFNEGVYDSVLSTLIVPFNTSNVTNMSHMFAYLIALESLDVSSFITTNVTNMNYMFGGCASLTEINVSGFNTSNVTDMGYMFAGRQSGRSNTFELYQYYTGHITSLDLSNFDTSKVTNMSYMFAFQPLLNDINILSFDTRLVTTMEGMFRGNQALTTLDLSSFDTHSVTNMKLMFGVHDTHSGYFSVKNYFNGSEMSLSLSTIYVSNSWNVDAVTESWFMFKKCVGLPNYNASIVDKTRAHYDTGGYLQLKQ